MFIVLDKRYNLVGKFTSKEKALDYIKRIDQLDNNQYYIY